MKEKMKKNDLMMIFKIITAILMIPLLLFAGIISILFKIK